jgi:hypothetical protein
LTIYGGVRAGRKLMKRPGVYVSPGVFLIDVGGVKKHLFVRGDGSWSVVDFDARKIDFEGRKGDMAALFSKPEIGSKSQ